MTPGVSQSKKSVTRKPTVQMELTKRTAKPVSLFTESLVTTDCDKACVEWTLMFMPETLVGICSSNPSFVKYLGTFSL